jgi:TonB family protein
MTVMKFLSPSRIGNTRRRRSFFLFALVVLPAIFFQSVLAQSAQPAQLSLADILIALRSKKVNLAERNKLIGDAVKMRGITFALTPEIEKELESTGAAPDLIGAIKLKSRVETLAQNAQVKPVSIPAPVPMATPTPAPPDFNFYQHRADGFVAKGDLDSAVADYGKAIELRSNEPSAYLNRGMALLGKKNYDMSIQDFSKVIELDPKQAVAYLNRGNSFENKGDIQKALNDYQKAADLDPNNEVAKTGLQRLQAEQAKLDPPVQTPPQPEPKPAANAAVSETAKPTSLPLGAGLKDQAVKLVMPIYTSMDRQRNLQGIVTVEVALDEEGKVVDAKATTGPKLLRASAEDAARRTKFKPALFEGKPIKASGFINYNFVGQ